MHLDLNVEPPPEEEPSRITPSIVTSPTAYFVPSGGNYHPPGDQMELFIAGSSTRDPNPIKSPFPTLSSKRTGDEVLEQRTNKFPFWGKKQQNSFWGKRKQDSSKNQVGGASEDGNKINNIFEPNQPRLKEVGKKPMETVKDSLNSQHESSHRLESTQEESPLRYFSAFDWKYVIVEEDQDISNHPNYAWFNIHNQKELFKYWNKFHSSANGRETFWIEKSQENRFFDWYKSRMINHLHQYPELNKISQNRRVSAIQDTLVTIYDKNIRLEEGMKFLEKIRTSLKLKMPKNRIERIGKIVKMSTKKS
ncbi:hypothetical protein PCASD_09368 [Puccinia coronata f. sp. avenae]|uniref:Uncharacterized protein n=1 Tax=Puccinia coronata f. sp. avenae TaxID=200324 RepID=A0A2N5V1E8_9BASI|nr:hypothetical protein PCASD_09368 [Puccinia coronata f. sp. avenae]